MQKGSEAPSSPDLTEFIQLSLNARSQRKPCAIRIVYDQLMRSDREDEAEALLSACEVDKDTISSPGISKWLGDRGFEVNNNAIGNHRRHGCSCNAPAPVVGKSA